MNYTLPGGETMSCEEGKEPQLEFFYLTSCVSSSIRFYLLLCHILLVAVSLPFQLWLVFSSFKSQLKSPSTSSLVLLLFFCASSCWFLFAFPRTFCFSAHSLRKLSSLCCSLVLLSNTRAGAPVALSSQLLGQNVFLFFCHNLDASCCFTALESVVAWVWNFCLEVLSFLWTKFSFPPSFFQVQKAIGQELPFDWFVSKGFPWD